MTLFCHSSQVKNIFILPTSAYVDYIVYIYSPPAVYFFCIFHMSRPSQRDYLVTINNPQQQLQFNNQDVRFAVWQCERGSAGVYL